MKMIVLIVSAVACFCVGSLAFADGSGIGSVAAHVTTNLPNLAKLITGLSYVAGMAFGIGAIVKFKAHKDQPTQVPVSTGVVLLFVAAALLYIPGVFKTSGTTMFAASGMGKISGVSSF